MLKGCLSAEAPLAVALPRDADADHALTLFWYAGTRMLRQLLLNLRCRPRCSALSRFWRPSRRGEPPVLLTTLQDQAATGCLNCLPSCRLCSWHVTVRAVYFSHVLLLHIHRAASSHIATSGLCFIRTSYCHAVSLGLMLLVWHVDCHAESVGLMPCLAC